MSTTTKKPTAREDLAARLAAIEGRITARAVELADIESKQLAAATNGDVPDQALVTRKTALIDAQSIDERAAAAVRGRIDQLDAEEQRRQQLAELASTRRQAADTARQAAAAADTFAAEWQAAHETVRAVVEGLCARLAEVRQLTEQSERLQEEALNRANHLGEPHTVVAVVDHVSRLSALGAMVGGGALPVTEYTTAPGRLFTALLRGDHRQAAAQFGITAWLGPDVASGAEYHKQQAQAALAWGSA